ncbi:MAG: iron-only hydrogenase system regulator [Ruminococcus sp.]|nr:iron-only hydrogenase system regulator [Ruminococcus sp.]
METRVAVISIILESSNSIEEVNKLISDYSDYVVGRMGIPYKKRGISIISLVIDSPQDVISTFSGKLGKLDGVCAKTAYSKFVFNDD